MSRPTLSRSSALPSPPARIARPWIGTPLADIRARAAVSVLALLAVLAAVSAPPRAPGVAAGAPRFAAAARAQATAEGARIALPLVARAVGRGDLLAAATAQPSPAPPSPAPSDEPLPSPLPPPTDTPPAAPPTPTMRACAGWPLAERIGVTRTRLDGTLRASDEYYPLPLAARADGGALVAWRDARTATVRVGATGVGDDRLVPAVRSFAAEEVHALVAHDDGGGALVVVDPDAEIYSPKYCRGPSTPDKAMCGKVDVWRFDADGTTVWRRTVTGRTNVDRDGAEFVWWYQHTARLVWTGDGYGLYYRNAVSSPRPGVPGEIDIHAADAFRLLSAAGEMVPHAWRWGCSHSWAVRLAFDGAFGTACHGDGFPNAFHVVRADAATFHGESNLQDGVDPTRRALGGLVAAPGGGFWLSYLAPSGGAGGGTRLHLARIDTAGRVASDTVLAAAANLPTQYPFRAYLAAYGDGRLLAGWPSGGRLQLAVLDAHTGALVDGPTDAAAAGAQIDAWNEFVALAHGDVGWAHAADRAAELAVVRVRGCR